jgi:DNA-directed RNA polymerase specialized sigma24 family protein
VTVDHAGANVYEALTVEWIATTRRRAARQAVRAWGQLAPSLAGYASPADLVADINYQGDPDRSSRLLADVLIVAGRDQLAARAALQAILPGLRATTRHRWRQSATAGPWATPQDLAAETISAAWETIQAHAGHQHPRPAAVIVRDVERHLRTAHDRWRNHSSAAPHPPAAFEPTQSLVDAAYSAERQAVTTITEAAGSGAINHSEAALLIATGVLGHTLDGAADNLGLPTGPAYQALHRARTALRAASRPRPSHPLGKSF